MTRKQALTQAISILSANKENSKTVELLQDIYDEMPFNHWTDKAIRDSIDQFILDTGKIPTTRHLGRGGLPSNAVIKNRYKMQGSDWLDQNYPRRVKTRKEIKEERLAGFIKEYKRLKPVGPKEFNAARRDGVICWATAARYIGLRGWTTLIAELKLPVYEREKKVREPQKFNVVLHSDMDEEIKKLRPEYWA